MFLRKHNIWFVMATASVAGDSLEKNLIISFFCSLENFMFGKNNSKNLTSKLGAVCWDNENNSNMWLIAWTKWR